MSLKLPENGFLFLNIHLDPFPFFVWQYNHVDPEITYYYPKNSTTEHFYSAMRLAFAYSAHRLMKWAMLHRLHSSYRHTRGICRYSYCLALFPFRCRINWTNQYFFPPNVIENVLPPAINASTFMVVPHALRGYSAPIRYSRRSGDYGLSHHPALAWGNIV